MTTITDIARALNLSTATVSNALTGKGRISEVKRKNIITTAQEMGYDFNRIRAHKQVKKICVLIEHVGVVFADSILEGICSAADELDYTVVTYNMNLMAKTSWDMNPSAETVREIAQRCIDKLDASALGLIYVSQYPRDITGVLPRLPFPVVYAYAYANEPIPCVNYNDQQGAFIATDHLISLGRKRVAMISGHINSIPMTKRFTGYQRALIQSSLAFDIGLVRIGHWSSASGKEAMQDLLSMPQPPDAVFCQSDHIAMGAIAAIREAGMRVPEDVAIVGFDNMEFGWWCQPSLSTIAPPCIEIGQQSFGKLVSILDNRDNGEMSVKLDCKLIKREST